MLRRLHLGCGRDIKKGFINVDVVPLDGVDVVHDLEKRPYPFARNQFLEVEAHHTFEHIQEFMGMMEEIYRICAPGALISVSVPYFASPAFWRDPTHKRPFTINTFSYFQENSWYTKARFLVVKRRLFYFSCKRFMKSRWYGIPFDAIINLTPQIYERFFVYFLPASELHFLLRVDKKAPQHHKTATTSRVRTPH